MPLYLAPGTSSLLHAGSGALAGSEDCCCDDDDTSGCGCLESIGDLLGTTADVEIDGLLDANCFDCAFRLDGLFTASYDSACGWVYGSISVSPFKEITCGVGHDGVDYYLYVTARAPTFCTVGPSSQIIDLEWRLTIGPDEFTCDDVVEYELDFYSPGSNAACDASASTCKLTLNI